MDVYRRVWLYCHPPVDMGGYHVIVTFACHVVGTTRQDSDKGAGYVMLTPIAITWFGHHGGRIALGPETSLEAVQSLLSEGARWAEVV